MRMQSQLARWLHKFLTNRFTNAAWNTTFSILFSSIKRDSGLLPYKRTNDNISNLENALDELKHNNVLLGWKKDVRVGAKNRITDVLYTFTPHPAFSREVKAANGRIKKNVERLQLSEKPTG